MRYRSKPIEIEAMRWNVDGAGKSAVMFSAPEIVAWVNTNGGEARYEPSYFDMQAARGGPAVERPARIAVRTINGWAYAAPGHYVVMGEAWFSADASKAYHDTHQVRDHYPCDPETFERRWVRAERTDGDDT